MKGNESTEQNYYSVSETVQRSGVPSHVLRYWEEELRLPIRRTAQGHRIYSEADIEIFQNVKELKDKGIQLKAIRLLLEDTEDGLRLGQFFRQGEVREAETGISEAARLAEAGADMPEAGPHAEPAADMPESEQHAEPAADMPESEQHAELTVDISEAPPRRGAEAASQDADGAAYEIIPTAEAGNYQRFETMLRRLVSEAVEEQNQKLEQTLTEVLRDELEDLYLQLQQEEVKREVAAASQMKTDADGGKRGLLQRIRKIINAVI